MNLDVPPPASQPRTEPDSTGQHRTEYRTAPDSTGQHIGQHRTWQRMALHQNKPDTPDNKSDITSPSFPTSSSVHCGACRSALFILVCGSAPPLFPLPLIGSPCFTLPHLASTPPCRLLFCGASPTICCASVASAMRPGFLSECTALLMTRYAGGTSSACAPRSKPSTPNRSSRPHARTRSTASRAAATPLAAASPHA